MAEDNLAGNATQHAETPSEAYKQLQRKLEQARKREKVYQEQAAESQRMNAKIDALMDSNRQLMETLIVNGLVSDSDSATAAKTALDRNDKTSSGSDAALNEIMQELYEAETMWDDERLESARQAWGQGDYGGAAKLVAQALHGDAPEDERIEAEVQRRLGQQGAQRVDVHDSTAPASSAVLQDDGQLGATLAGPQGRDFWKTNKEQILKNIKEGRLPSP